MCGVCWGGFVTCGEYIVCMYTYTYIKCMCYSYGTRIHVWNW